MSLNYGKSEKVNLRDEGFDEKWLQNKIEEDTSLIGLGEVIVIQRERDCGHEVECTCGTRFCFNCSQPYHGRASCIIVKELEGFLDDVKQVSSVSAESVANWLVHKYPYANGIIIPTRTETIESAIPFADEFEITLKDNVVQPTDALSYTDALSKAAAVLQEYRGLVAVDYSLLDAIPEIENPLSSLINDDVCGEAKRSKFCPNCFVRIGRTGGCPSMECSICSYRFCYNCLGPQHTHDICTKSVDKAAITSLAGKLPSVDQDEALVAIQSLTLFSPVAEMAENEMELRASAVNEKTLKYRTMRHVPMTMRASRLELLLSVSIDTDACLNAIVRELYELSFLIEQEKSLLASVQKYVDNETKLYKYVMSLSQEKSFQTNTITTAKEIISGARNTIIESFKSRLNLKEHAPLLALSYVLAVGDVQSIKVIDTSIIDTFTVAKLLFQKASYVSGNLVNVIIDGRKFEGELGCDLEGSLTITDTVWSEPLKLPINQFMVPSHASCIAVISSEQLATLDDLVSTLLKAVANESQHVPGRIYESLFGLDQHPLIETQLIDGDVVTYHGEKAIVLGVYGTDIDISIGTFIKRVSTADVLINLPTSFPWFNEEGDQVLEALAILQGSICSGRPLYEALKRVGLVYSQALKDEEQAEELTIDVQEVTTATRAVLKKAKADLSRHKRNKLKFGCSR